MNGTDALERKILALERLLNAQRSGLLQHSTIMTLDSRGKTKKGAAQVLREELDRRGLSIQDFEDAGLDFIHLNLWWAEGRSVSTSEKGTEWFNKTQCRRRTHRESPKSATDWLSM